MEWPRTASMGFSHIPGNSGTAWVSAISAAAARAPAAASSRACADDARRGTLIGRVWLHRVCVNTGVGYSKKREKSKEYSTMEAHVRSGEQIFQLWHGTVINPHVRMPLLHFLHQCGA